jgi:hypothetical protein
MVSDRKSGAFNYKLHTEFRASVLFPHLRLGFRHLSPFQKEQINSIEQNTLAKFIAAKLVS